MGASIRLGILGALVPWCLNPVRAEPPPAPAADTVTFELKANLIFAPGSAGGGDGLSFIVDTGASVTVLRPETAKRIGVKVEPLPGDGLAPQGGLLGALGKLLPKGGTGVVPSIGLGKAVVRDLPVLVMAVPQAEIPLKLQGIPYDGILGYNYLSRFRVTIDYAQKTIRLEPNGYVPEDPLAELRRTAKRSQRKRTEADGSERPEEKPETGDQKPQTRNQTPETAFVGLWPEAGADGVLVKKVLPGSPAETAGVRAGDRIRSAGGREILTLDDFLARVEGLRPGDTFALKLERGGEKIDVTVKVGAK